MSAIAEALRALLTPDPHSGLMPSIGSPKIAAARAALAAHDAAASADGCVAHGYAVIANGEVIAYGRAGTVALAVMRAARIAACVNACAGIADPVAAIAALRAIAEYAPGGELDSGWIHETASEGLK